MKRLLLSIIFLLSCVGCSQTCSVPPEITLPPVTFGATPLLPTDSSKKQYEYYLDACCRVYVSGSGGSGVCYMIDDKYVYILTCHHVVGSAKQAQIEFWRDGYLSKKYPGVVIKTLEVDVAVIVINRNLFGAAGTSNRPPRAIPIATKGPQPKSVIVSVGCAGFSWQTLFEGHVSSKGTSTMKNYNGGAPSYVFVPPPKGGRSGSGIFQDGKIVGILWGNSGEEGYAVRCEDFVKTVIPTTDGLVFMADWCDYCKSMKSTISALQKEGFQIQVFNYDLNTTLAELYGINSLPAYVNRSGDTLSGVRSIEELRSFFQKKEGK